MSRVVGYALVLCAVAAGAADGLLLRWLQTLGGSWLQILALKSLFAASLQILGESLGPGGFVAVHTAALQQWRRFFVGVVCGFLLTWVTAATLLSTSVESLSIAYSSPLWSALGSWYMFGELPRTHTIAALVAVSSCLITLMVLSSALYESDALSNATSASSPAHTSNVVGDVLALAGAFGGSCYLVASRDAVIHKVETDPTTLGVAYGYATVGLVTVTVAACLDALNTVTWGVIGVHLLEALSIVVYVKLCGVAQRYLKPTESNMVLSLDMVCCPTASAPAGTHTRARAALMAPLTLLLP